MAVKTYILIILFILIKFDNFAQTDSIKIELKSDSIIIFDADIIETEISNKKNPRRALLYSLALPGLGQAYVGKYWKIPVIYSALGGTAYLINSNNKKYKKYLTGLNEILWHQIDSTEYPITIFADNPDVETITQYKDKFRRTRDLSALLFITVYVFNLIDASVYAHLYDFDISDDLSLKIRPEVLPIFTQKNSNTIGLTFSFKF